MTDKQIIIDGVDVAKCRCFTSEWDFNNCGHICKGTECKYKRLWYKKQLKAKEQECEALQMSENEAGEIIAELQAYKDVNEDFKTAWEELKAENEDLNKIINEAKNSNLDLKSFLVGEAIQNEYEQQLDQLKVDREQALKQLEFVRTLNTVQEAEIRKLSKTLAEIKEIAETEIECKTYEIENDCFNETRCKALNEHIDFTKQILQKISECEANNDNK